MGKWSSAWGASAESACTDCGPGHYQPAVGQANQSSCLRCPPGAYGTVTGAEGCASCPEGSWNGDFGKTECHLCPEGKWIRSPGSLRGGDCMRCWGNGDCLPDGSARITIEFRNFPYTEIVAAGRLGDVEAAFAEDIASACSIENDSVVDLASRKAHVTTSTQGVVSAFVKDFGAVSSAGELAQRLYSASFRGELVNTTLRVLGGSSIGTHFGVMSVSLKPEKFIPATTSATITSTTATSTTATSTTASSTTITTTVTTQQHKDQPGATTTSLVDKPLVDGAVNQGSGIAVLLVCLAMAANGM